MSWFREEGYKGIFSSIKIGFKKEKSYQEEILDLMDNAMIEIYKAIHLFYYSSQKELSNFEAGFKEYNRTRKVKYPAQKSFNKYNEKERKEVGLKHLHKFQDILLHMMIYNRKIMKLYYELDTKIKLLTNFQNDGNENYLTHIQAEFLTREKKSIQILEYIQEDTSTLLISLDQKETIKIIKNAPKKDHDMGDLINEFQEILRDSIKLIHVLENIFDIEHKISALVEKYKKVYAENKIALQQLLILEEKEISFEEILIADFEMVLKTYLQAIHCCTVVENQIMPEIKTVQKIVGDARSVENSQEAFTIHFDKHMNELSKITIFYKKISTTLENIKNQLQILQEQNNYTLSIEYKEILEQTDKIHESINTTIAFAQRINSEFQEASHHWKDPNSQIDMNPEYDEDTNLKELVLEHQKDLLTLYQQIKNLFRLEKEVHKLTLKSFKLYRK